MGDVLFGHKPGLKRADKMGDRTLDWMKELIARMRDEEQRTPNTALFAPILPIETEQQSYYLNALEDDLTENVSGFALYDAASINAIPENMQHLPRLYLGESSSPHKVLDVVDLGIDILTIPFINQATDAGIALDFSFPTRPQPDDVSLLPIGQDMWSPAFSTITNPLTPDCKCYTCTNHHCAFVQHLLNAKEMLAWVLLQLHNHHTIDNFFAGIRHSISNGTFENDRATFQKSHTAKFPAKTGQGPR